MDINKLNQGICILALLTGCGEAPDIWIGPTAVNYEYFAEPYWDLNRVLWDTRKCLEHFNYAAEETLSIWLEIRGPGSKIDFKRDKLGYGRLCEFHLWGRYDTNDGPRIQVLQVGPPPYTFIDSVWIHEVLAHRVRDVVFGDKGEGGHATEWEAVIEPIAQCIRAKGCGWYASDGLERCAKAEN